MKHSLNILKERSHNDITQQSLLKLSSTLFRVLALLSVA